MSAATASRFTMVNRRGVKEKERKSLLRYNANLRYVLGVGEYRFKTRKRVRFAEHHHPVFV